MAEMKKKEAGQRPCKINERLLSALIGLARATEGNEELMTEETQYLLFQGISRLFMREEESYKGKDCNEAHQLTELLAQIREEKKRLVPNCFDCASPCGRTADYDMQEFWAGEEDKVSLKLEVVKCVWQIAAEVQEKAVSTGGKETNEMVERCLEALIVLGWNGSRESLLRVIDNIKK